MNTSERAFFITAAVIIMGLFIWGGTLFVLGHTIGAIIGIVAIALGAFFTNLYTEYESEQNSTSKKL